MLPDESSLGLTDVGQKKGLRMQSITSEETDGFPRALTIKEPAYD